MATKKRKQRIVLNAAQRKDVAHRLATGVSAVDLAAEYSVAVSTIHKIKKGAKESAPVTGGNVRDATIYLKQANRRLMTSIRNGQLKEPDGVHLLMLLALRTLEGAA